MQHLAKLMMVPESDVDAGRPLAAYGIDSLVAVEVSVFDLMTNIPMRQLATDLARRSSLLTQEA